MSNTFSGDREHSVKCRKRHFSVHFLEQIMGEVRMHPSVSLWFNF